MALSNAEIFEHLGRMINHGFDLDEPDVEWAKELIPWAKDWVTNGTFGTEAERTEAMVTIREKAFAKITGLDPVADAHTMNNHWIPNAEGE